MGHCFFIHFCLLYKSLKKKINKFNSYYMYMYKEPFLFCCCFFVGGGGESEINNYIDKLQ